MYGSGIKYRNKKTKAYYMYIPVTGKMVVYASCIIPNKIYPDKGILGAI
jgi:hypothetical protein